MGMYDDVTVGDRAGQVKLWDCVLATYRTGSRTPDRGLASYSIAMREGGYVHVENSVIVGWEEHPMAGHPIYDKYGVPFEEASGGLFGEGYFFQPSREEKT